MGPSPSLFSILSRREVLLKKIFFEKLTSLRSFSNFRHSLLVLGSDPVLKQHFPWRAKIDFKTLYRVLIFQFYKESSFKQREYCYHPLSPSLSIRNENFNTKREGRKGKKGK